MQAATLPLITLAEMSSKGIDLELVEQAKLLMTRALFSEKILTGSVAAYYIHKALRTGAWRHLNPVSRALLLALSKWSGVVKSMVLRGILSQVFIEIELYTVRGKAIFYGIIVSLSRARELLVDLARNIQSIIVMGIQYMNLPVLWRIYG